MDALNTKIYVISIDGHPLKPCSPAIARFLLKIKRAEVVSKEPFTIKLNYEPGIVVETVEKDSISES